MMRALVTILLFILIVGCVDTFRINIDDGGGQLVVDGWITTQPGPYYVKLSRGINFDNGRPLRVFPLPERSATVLLHDDNGFSEKLVEYAPGNYRTINAKGEVGRTYYITIALQSGQTYSSEPERLEPVAAVEGMEFEFKIYDRFFINMAGQLKSTKGEGFWMYARTRDPQGFGDYYRWQTEGIFEFFSLTNNPDIKQCWAPVARLETSLNISDDTDVENTSFRKFVCVVPYDRPTKYLVKVRQQSLTQRAHEFWNRSLNQQAATGSLFDPPPTSIPGNITNDNNDDEQVMGYFGASAISSYSFLLNRLRDSGFVAPNPNPDLIPGDCRVQQPSATNIKPEGF